MTEENRKQVLKVLYVEDDRHWHGIIAEALREAFKDTGVELDFHFVETYEAASKALENGPWDFCLLDWNLSMDIRPGHEIYTEPLIRKAIAKGWPTGVISGSKKSLEDFENRLKDEGVHLPVIRVFKGGERLPDEQIEEQLRDHLEGIISAATKETEAATRDKEKF